MSKSKEPSPSQFLIVLSGVLILSIWMIASCNTPKSNTTPITDSTTTQRVGTLTHPDWVYDEIEEVNFRPDSPGNSFAN